MQTDFPSAGLSASNTVTTGTATNGDDSYQITMDGAVISQFGVENEDGTGTRGSMVIRMLKESQVQKMMEHLV